MRFYFDGQPRRNGQPLPTICADQYPVRFEDYYNLIPVTRQMEKEEIPYSFRYLMPKAVRLPLNIPKRWSRLPNIIR